MASYVYIRISKYKALYLEHKVNGRKKWTPLNLRLTGDKQEDKKIMEMAEKARNLMERQMAAQQWGLQDPVYSRLSIEDYAARIAEGMNKKTHLPKVLKYLREYSGGTKITAVTERWLEGFRSFLQAQDQLGETTAAHYFQAIKMLMRRAYHERVILQNPAEFVKGLTIPESQRIWLTMDEIKKLMEARPMGRIGEEMKRGFLFACMTGLRISDLRALKWCDVKKDGTQIEIIKRQQKTKNFVYVPVNESAWKIIDDGQPHEGNSLIFPKLSESKTEPTQYFRYWERSAGLEHHIGWHTARHTFAVLSLENGADLYTVSKLLGHRSIKTTEVYARATDKMKREAVERLSLPNYKS